MAGADSNRIYQSSDDYFNSCSAKGFMLRLMFALVLVTGHLLHNFETIFSVEIPVKILLGEATCNLMFLRVILQRFVMAYRKWQKKAENKSNEVPL